MAPGMAAWRLNRPAICLSQVLSDLRDVTTPKGVLLSQHEMSLRVHSPVLRIPLLCREVAGVPTRQPYLHSNKGKVRVAGFRPAQRRRLCRAKSPLATPAYARDLFPTVD